MAGHSQFKNIMHRKGAQDQMRAKIFSKLAREITVAAKTGLPDPAANPRLRSAILAARAENMPKDNIERAIKKGTPGEDNTVYEEIRYEGFGPGNVAVIVEALTDNRARTAPNLRSIFSKKGGNLGETGSVTFNFERVGLIEYPLSVADADAMSHLDSVVELICWRAYLGEDIMTCNNFVKTKIMKSYAKMSDDTKKMMKDKYDSIMKVLL